MEIPDYQTLMLPLLQYLSDGKEHQINECANAIAKHFKLTEKQQNQLLPNSNYPILKDRMGWAKSYMKMAGLIKNDKRGIYQITDAGLSLIKSNPQTINNQLLMQYPSFQEFLNKSQPSQKSKTEKDTEDINLEEEKRTPSEMMREALGQVNHQLGEDLIDKVISMSPQFFERLVIELMEKMGYGEGKITNYTKDGGIDGIINEDKLGLGKIFIQAKRYQRGNNVGSPMTDAFVGAITKKGGNKGVFITTSDFTSSAKDNRSQSVKVAYINGLDLAKLMIQYSIGVTAVDTYVVNKIDSDYFDE